MKEVVSLEDATAYGSKKYEEINKIYGIWRRYLSRIVGNVVAYTKGLLMGSFQEGQ